MIIASGNVSLSSSRKYERSTRMQQTTTSWQLTNPANMNTSVRDYRSGYMEEEYCENYNDFAKILGKSKNRQGEQEEKNWKEANQEKESSMAWLNDSPGLGMNLWNAPMGTRKLLPQAELPQNVADSIGESASKTLHRLILLLYKARGFKVPSYEESSNQQNQMQGMRSVNVNMEVGNYGNLSTIWNRVTDTRFSFYESETTTFAGEGMAVTADGRELHFNVEMSMSRTFMEEYQESIFTQQSFDLMDPLVIKLDSNPEWVSDQTFLFDLDSDGKEDNITALAKGNGFLALDLNEDGIINDGRELFGTKSGNGFRDLAAYDVDGNGWIDEADEIYEKLRVFTLDEKGNPKLMNLKEADVGAIYLGSARTKFTETGEENETLAMVRSSGLFLHEDGSSGVVAQLDLAKYA